MCSLNLLQKVQRKIVMEFIEFTESRDFQLARGYLKDKVSYLLPLNSLDRAKPYLKYNTPI
jgi:hypothetical protein